MTIVILTGLALALAADGGSKSFFTSPELWRVINLLVFVLILIYILRNKIGIGKLFENRAVSITRDLEQARKDKEQALSRLAEVEARLGRLDQEVAEMRVEAESQAAREAERIRQAADVDAEKIRQMTQREIEGAVKAARNELQSFVAEQSVRMAEEVIRREIRPEDNARILTRYTDELREVKR